MTSDIKSLVLKKLLWEIDRLNKYKTLAIINGKLQTFKFDCHEVRVYEENKVSVWSDNFDERFDFTWEEIDEACAKSIS